MEINKIIIKNFRSIKEQEISLKDQQIFILLGINEVGKSNILKAIALKDNPEILNSYKKDCHKEANKENIEITYVLEGDWRFYLSEFSNIPEDLITSIEIEKIEIIVSIGVNDEKLNYSLKVFLKDNIPRIENFVWHENQIKKKEENNLTKDGKGNVTNLISKENLERILRGQDFYDLFKKDIPRIIFWKSEEKYLKTKGINLSDFKDNLEISIPLKNCFLIAGYKKEEIANKIEEVLNSSNASSSLEGKLSNQVTEFFRKSWKEHKIGFVIHISGGFLDIFISDNDDSNYHRYELSDRSDGFNQFASILLNLSIESKEEELKNTIILLDEPEVHLHPSGQKYLFSELEKIAEKNKVFFATHSIFMVDQKNLGVHYSVKKTKGETKIDKIPVNDPFKEEVLYKALGTSIFNVLHDTILLFEGKTDRDIFNLYNTRSEKPLNISLISADGVNNLIRYAKLLSKPLPSLIKTLVIFDSDKDGKEQKKIVLGENNYNESNVFEINDLIKGNKTCTLEDLFEKSIIEKVIKKFFGESCSLNDKKPFEKQIKEIFQKKRIKYKGEEKNNFKQKLFKEIIELKKESLQKQKYYKFFEELVKKINP